MRYRRLGRLLIFALLATIFGIGCQRTPGSLKSDMCPTVTSEAFRALDLASRLKSLSTDEQNSLRQLLASPDSIDLNTDARLVEIAHELCRLTLTEANELGRRLDAEQTGTVSEFALTPLRRQTWALNQIQQIQARMTRKTSAQNPEQVWSATFVTENRDLSWLKERTGANVTEVTTLDLAYEPDDLGPVQSDICDD